MNIIRLRYISIAALSVLSLSFVHQFGVQFCGVIAEKFGIKGLHWRIQERPRDSCLNPRSNFFHFHAGSANICPNNSSMHTPLGFGQPP